MNHVELAESSQERFIRLRDIPIFLLQLQGLRARKQHRRSSAHFWRFENLRTDLLQDLHASPEIIPMMLVDGNADPTDQEVSAVGDGGVSHLTFHPVLGA